MACTDTNQPTPPPRGHAVFVNGDQFRPHYQRNNKQGGHKNLRCFPTCSHGVHVSVGFCGSPVLVGFTWAPDQVQQVLHAYATFAPLVGGAPQWTTFTSLPEDDDDGWYHGAFVGITERTVMFRFNTLLRGWHYGWQGNRHTAMTQHALCVYFLTTTGDGGVQVVDRIPSPPFRIFSRRRAKTTKYLKSTPSTVAHRPLRRSLTADAALWTDLLDDTDLFDTIDNTMLNL
ncbi:hypothetical protein ACHHYP_01877 [Achlya hypogyna]|uniref:Uncharacterized protein n=1 Tax=Achlya hypogyna TaxID=1202772 RepID=A0A1V9ZSR6_ACHHY|nr:hypothetical protein ACHHYP_01877 [Achlya hypogyna]